MNKGTGILEQLKSSNYVYIKYEDITQDDITQWLLDMQVASYNNNRKFVVTTGWLGQFLFWLAYEQCDGVYENPLAKELAYLYYNKLSTIDRIIDLLHISVHHCSVKYRNDISNISEKLYHYNKLKRDTLAEIRDKYNKHKNDEKQ